MFEGYSSALQRLTERQQLLLSAIVLIIAFSLRALVRGDYVGAIALALAVAIGFVFHELSHRRTAIKLGYIARYRLWPTGLLLALLLSIITLGRVVFAAPGAVVIYPRFHWMPVSRSDYFKIAASGPLANIVIGLLSYLALHLPLTLPVYIILLYIAYVNLFLALFNLLPIPPLDGYTVFRYSIKYWMVLFIVAAIPFITLLY